MPDSASSQNARATPGFRSPTETPTVTRLAFGSTSSGSCGNRPDYLKCVFGSLGLYLAGPGLPVTPAGRTDMRDWCGLPSERATVAFLARTGTTMDMPSVAGSKVSGTFKGAVNSPSRGRNGWKLYRAGLGEGRTQSGKTAMRAYSGSWSARDTPAFRSDTEMKTDISLEPGLVTSEAFEIKGNDG